MRWSVFAVLQSLIILVATGVIYIHQDHVIVLKEPPESIAQWYKPQNKRQVLLHTMFKLRREILALETYTKTQDDENLQKWSEKLYEDYHKISEMVPEWEKRLDLDTIAEIQKSVKEKRYGDVTRALDDLDESCQSCHADFRAVTATKYRAPDFSEMRIDSSTSLISHMRTVSNQVNQIKIAFVDGRQDAALSALSGLERGMSSLGNVCVNCHEKDPKAYPNAMMKQSMLDLEQTLKTGSLRDQGEALGTLAVMACAECHGTHRLSFDAKNLLNKKKSWGELLKHYF
jgi:cytochrome c556